jgi:hypothetical protein
MNDDSSNTDLEDFLKSLVKPTEPEAAWRTMGRNVGSYFLGMLSVSVDTQHALYLATTLQSVMWTNAIQAAKEANDS